MTRVFSRSQYIISSPFCLLCICCTFSLTELRSANLVLNRTMSESNIFILITYPPGSGLKWNEEIIC